MARHHARSIGRLTNLAKVCAVCDPTESARAAFREVAPDAQGYPTLQDALANERFDVVHIVTPPITHESLATAAIEAGCNIYVEKPFVETASAAERLLRAAERRNLKVCSGHQLLFEEPAVRVRKYLNVLGDVRHVESYFSFRVIKRNPDGRAPLRDDLQLLDILPHPVYLLLDTLARSAEGSTELAGLEIGPTGTIHALLRRGNLTGTLLVTIEGRPIDSFLRVIGTNGELNADFVRSTLYRNLGPGISGIDKLLAPYKRAWQLLTGTTASLGRRFLSGQRSYPGLVEIFEAFYNSIQANQPSPVSPEQILDTVRLCEEIAARLAAVTRPAVQAPAPHSEPTVLVTGGTGLLGAEVARQLARSGRAVRVLARREPAGWDRIPGVEYAVADLSHPLPMSVLAGVDSIINCAAETAGGYDEHQRNSIDVVDQLMTSAQAAGIARFLHVSSISVMAQPKGSRLVDEASPLEPNSRALGPYAWGKTISEMNVTRKAGELGIGLRVVRPGAFVDYRRYEPPGLLGKRVGNLFVAAGSPNDPLAAVDIGFSAATLVWILDNFDEAPPVLHLFDPAHPSKRDLVRRLREVNPDIRVIWLPMFLLVPLSWMAIVLQKLLRPRGTALNIAKTFARQRYDYSLIISLAPQIRGIPIRTGGSQLEMAADTVARTR